MLLVVALFLERHDGAFIPVHRRRDRRADGIDRTPQRVRIKVRISVRGSGLRVSEKLSYDRQTHGRARADAGEGMA
jgi:hypothetical protein